MSLKSLLVSLSAAFLIGGCGAPPTFKESVRAAGFDKKISKDLFVVFETSHLQAAFKTTSGYPIVAGNAVLAQLEKKLAAEGVTITKEVIDSTRDRTQLARRIQANPGKKQVLMIQADSFEQSQRTRNGAPLDHPFWNGNVTWLVRLYDLTSAEVSAGTPSWSVKTNNYRFDAAECASAKEPYASCGAALANGITAQLLSDGMFAR